jgi:hypothetical protein
VGGSATSQHVKGEAADCSLSVLFLTDERARPAREKIRTGVAAATGRQLRPDVGADGYLFAHVCLNLDALDIDQVIHEYGGGFGAPAWVHMSSSRQRDRRQILLVGSYTNNSYITGSVEEALAYLT